VSVADRPNTELLIGYLEVSNDDWERGVFREGEEKVKQLKEVIAGLERSLANAKGALRKLERYDPDTAQAAQAKQWAAVQQVSRQGLQGLLPEHQQRLGQPRVANSE
jgi:hypothetical protein